RPEDVGARRELPGPRRQEPVCRRRRAVRLERPQELHLDDPRAGDANIRVHRAAAQSGDTLMATLTRRDALRIVTSAPFAAALVWTPAEARQAHEHADAARAANRAAPFKPKFFTAHELATVTVLVDLIIPRDERSGSATDAGVPQFMDFMMIDQPQRQIA